MWLLNDLINIIERIFIPGTYIVSLGYFQFNLYPVIKYFQVRGFWFLLDFFATFGWLFVAKYLLTKAEHYLADYKVEHYTSNWKWVLLAIDIPAINVQTPKAVEQMFAHLAGAYEHCNIEEKYRHGFVQRWFSFEIISIGGYIQFLVRTEERFRDLVEAAIYAQYPDIEITEVEDYVKEIPTNYPNKEYDLWGADFGLAQSDAYPIRSYREFEHNISKDTVLKDPMGTFLESFSRIGPGEQMWFQIIVEPVGSEWKEKAMESINELIGAEESKSHGGGGFLSESVDKIWGTLSGFFFEIVNQLFGTTIGGGGGEEHAEESGPPNKLQYLTPGQTKLVEAMEDKISKIGLKTSMRGIYLARKEVFNPNRGVTALLGAINQYNIQTANSLIPKYSVGAHYYKAEQVSNSKKTEVIEAYASRSHGLGDAGSFVLNIEELATVWHFPMSHVKTPLIQRTSTKQAEPPAGLPVEEVGVIKMLSQEEEKNKEIVQKKKYTTDSGHALPYSDDFKFG